MNLDEVLHDIQNLSNLFGPPGEEERVRDYIQKNFSNIVDKIWSDNLGNLFLEKRGDEEYPTIMLAAHMDEVGLLITHIEKNGFLRFATLGGIDPRTLYAQKILIQGEEGFVKGYIGATPPHLLPKDFEKKVPDVTDLFIDIGVSSKEEAEELGVFIGAKAVYDSTFMKISKNRVMGKALDDRVGIAVMLNVLKELKSSPYNIIAVATIQEEVGLRGAKISTWNIEPEYALILECTAAGDVPGAPSHKMSTQLGKGPAITIADKSLITHPKVFKALVEAAKENNIPYQFKQMMVGGTDAGAISLTRDGIPAGVISTPARYIHSPYAIADIRDIENQIRLAIAFIEKISK